MADHQDFGMTRMNLNYSTVMKDLLVHPEVRQAWEELKAEKRECHQEVKLEWHKESVLNLLGRLERAKFKYGPHLALEAYNLLPTTLNAAQQSLSHEPSLQRHLFDQQPGSTPRTCDDVMQVDVVESILDEYNNVQSQHKPSNEINLFEDLPPELTISSSAEWSSFVNDDNGFGAS